VLTTPHRVIYVAPAPGSGGVGDYAADIAAALGDHDVQVTFLPTGGPGRDTIASILRLRRRIRRELDWLGPGTIVHLEASAASIAPLWAVTRAVDLVTATVHDPPHVAWWPARTQLVHRSPIAVHGLHLPIAPLWWAVERHRTRHVRLIALSRMGCESMRCSRPVLHLPHYVPDRPPIQDAVRRPLGVGLFGQVYGGKGFERVAELRRRLPADIALHVAGRGTDALSRLAGVQVWGPIDGQREAAFFSQIRAVLLPYDAGGRYGPSYSASGASARAYAYGTPVAATPVRSFTEEARHGALLLVPAETSAMVEAVTELVTDAARVRAASDAARRLAEERHPRRVAAHLVGIWDTMAHGSRLPMAS
jgi:polysaccharide biosynthesis protein PslF